MGSILDFLTQQQEPDRVQGILTQRFEPTAQDVGNSALAGIGSNQYVNPQQYADQRMDDTMKQLSAVMQMKKLQSDNLPQGYRMGAGGRAELIPGVDESYGKKADPYSMPVPVLMPNGQPGFAPRSQVTSGGYQPIPTASATPKPPNGYSFGAPDETGAPTLIPIAGGPADPANKPMNEYQGKSALFASRMSDAEPILTKLKDTNTLGQRTLSMLPLSNYMVSNDFQQLDQAKRNFINATLRQESGASINQSEYDNAEKQYFPQPGDGPDVIAQKAQNRATAIRQMGEAAGQAYKAQNQGRSIVKTQVSPSTGRRKIIYSDGTEEIQ